MHHCQKDGGGVEPINNWSKPQHSSQLCIGDLQIPHTHLVNFSLFVSRRRILQVGSFCRGYYSGGICFIVIGLNAMSPCYVSMVMTHTNWQLIRCMWFDLEDKIVLCPQKLSCTVELMNDDTKPAHNCVQARRLLGSLVSEWRMCLNFGETRDCAFCTILTLNTYYVQYWGPYHRRRKQPTIDRGINVWVAQKLVNITFYEFLRCPFLKIFKVIID